MSINWSEKSDQVSVWDNCACADDIEGCCFDLIIFLRKKCKTNRSFILVP